MPCRWSRRNRQPASPEDDAVMAVKRMELLARFSHRREKIRMMRKQTRTVVLLMALMEALRVGPAQLVFAGKEGYAAPGENDFGIAYWVGFMISYIYMCIFMVIFVPFFSWWIPSLPSDDSQSGKCVAKVMNYLKKFDLFILPIGIGLALVQHAYYLLHTLIHVDSPGALFRKPENTRKTWAARLLLIAGIGFSLVFGYYAFAILETTHLARVKSLEYYLIVMPIQVNIGCVIGGVMQWKMEKRIIKKQARKADIAKMEEGTQGEKEALIDA